MAANLASSDLPLANPVWGALPVEQYLIQNWSDESPTPPASQRRALLRRLAFEHDALPASCRTTL
ncbi:hypothetical protein QBC33DRAFT_553560 [Phialemonium atrogriseum]|uniref:Uncharacterized protein n=1 Tax=Phialemonium atrogriseum TaxID=1093897 RepID=A0AAJ0CAU3_9PEZI|nr:uncharacterized protein QBC33DRAFT_553560 [Phialemonium atrogriseum]KAK1772098.1 hypothetical protein QBC33DRAFT_553560 [Phialemonium atrogriseum]